MRSIIREFYLGNLSPDATAIRQGSKLQKAVQEVSDAESFLREHLDGECLAALERLVSAQLTSSTTTAEERYMDGFRTRAGLCWTSWSAAVKTWLRWCNLRHKLHNSVPE